MSDEFHRFIDALIECANEGQLFYQMQNDARTISYLLRTNVMEEVMKKRMVNIFHILLTGPYQYEDLNFIFHRTIRYNFNDHAEMILNSGKLDLKKLTEYLTVLDCALKESISISLIERLITNQVIDVNWNTIEIAASRYPQFVPMLLARLPQNSVMLLLFKTENTFLGQVIFQYVESITIEARMDMFISLILDLAINSTRKNTITTLHTLLGRTNFTVDYRFFEKLMTKKGIVHGYIIEYIATHNKIINCGGICLINWHIGKFANERRNKK